MEDTLESYQQELDRCHQVIKDSTDYAKKRNAVLEAAEWTARYLAATYRIEGLYNYRRIESMAARLPTLVSSQLEIADRHYNVGSGWRADIALNSLGLDLYIMHTKADDIAAVSAGRLPESQTAGNRTLLQKILQPIITRSSVMFSMWGGKHRRSAETDPQQAITAVQALKEDAREIGGEEQEAGDEAPE
jgi:hypothetical protein